jgi:ATP-binding cassette, subfamily B, bacterial
LADIVRATAAQGAEPEPPPPPIPRSFGRRQAFESLFGGSWIRAALLVVCATAMGFAEAGVLAVVARAATTLATGTGNVDASIGSFHIHATLGHLLLVGGALAVVRLILLVPTAMLSAGITADVQARMLRGLFDSFVHASWSLKATDREGHLQELMTNQVSQATLGPAYATMLVTNLFAFLALIAAAVLISPQAAGIVLGVSAILFAMLRPLSRAGSRSASDLSAAQLEQAGGVSEATRLAEETEVFGVGEAQRRHVGDLIDRVHALVFRTQLALRLVPSAYQSAVYLLLVGGLAIVYAVDKNGLAALGAVVLLLVRAGTYANLAQLAYQSVRQALPFASRVTAAEHRYTDAAPPHGTESFDSVHTLSFHDVSFAYPGGNRVLADLNFDVREGETIGIIGPSGAGKSTLAQLLLRLREPTAGRYLVNGIPATDLRPADWTSRVAFVPQTPQLIYGSVADNIRYFREVDEADVERAAQLARIDPDIKSWRAGYQTVVGPRAAAVSVGQAQRLCLARALALRPRILLLDEPTSALDPTSERLVQESLTQLKGDLTVFVIAHRMSTLDICDRVMVLVNGRLDAFEPFTSLGERSAYYRSAIGTSP